jgi:hypothetical protein
MANVTRNTRAATPTDKYSTRDLFLPLSAKPTHGREGGPERADGPLMRKDRGLGMRDGEIKETSGFQAQDWLPANGRGRMKDSEKED